ncbi:MAG TPA: NUDIX domain-containing protein [Candidatus Paceibacterota bacterium]
MSQPQFRQSRPGMMRRGGGGSGEFNHSIRDESVKKQIVAGFIVYRKTEEGTKYLFLYRRGSYWNFPKGHFEPGENALATAFRETEEETGLKRADLHLAQGFKTYVKFHFEKDGHRIYDTVILYLAETKKAEVVVSPREHSGFAWFLYPDAMHILGRYQGTKRALQQANDFLRRKGIQRNSQNPAR